MEGSTADPAGVGEEPLQGGVGAAAARRRDGGGAGVAGGGGSRFRRAEPSREPAMCHQGLDILHILM